MHYALKNDAPAVPAATPAQLLDWARQHPRWLVITGAGCSTEVGIPDYRDQAGQWKRPQPVTYQAFMGDALVRQRYWARSLVGWR
ncbi:MAG: Sir2 family NAD-dependent protein deacetylase, partial [Comamonas sp.]